jgi:hypothetical protein
MDEDEWFVVKDVEGFVKSARTLVYNNFGDWNKDEDTIVESMLVKPEDENEFNELLTQEECSVIVKNALKKQRNKTTNAIRYLVCDSLFYEILNQLNDRMVSNTIGSLVQKGLVESAYDSEIDDFVFWVNDKNKELPETD